jgi:pyruvate dehydrogenase (quinone)
MDVADFVAQRIADWDVERIYGYPGDGINGVVGAIQRRKNRPRFIQTRHEEAAALMACAEAKWTGHIGVCLATSGPGAIHLLNGLYDAKLDHQPVVAIVGQQSRMSLGGAYMQEVDLQSLFKDVASEFVAAIVVPEQARHVVDRAFRTARSQRTVTCIIVPNDVQRLEAVAEPPKRHGAVFSGIGYDPPLSVPRDEQLREAASLLNEGDRVAILVGQGALDATGEILETADLLGAGIAKALLGKAVVPDDLPYVTGAMGMVGTRPSWRLMSECDTLLIIGSSFPYAEFLPQERHVPAVQIDIDPRLIGLRYPARAVLVGDSRDTLRLLNPLLVRKADRSWRQRIKGWVRESWETVEEVVKVPADPVNPELVIWELSRRLPDGAIVSADSGSIAAWFARDLKLRRGMMASLSGNLATVGNGVPYAIAAKFTHPDRPAFALVGDGSMQMLGMSELLTIGRHWREWLDPRLIILVLHNNDLNLVTWEQRVSEGDPKFVASQELPDVHYARFAELAGLRGIRIEKPGDVAGAWDAALSADRPVVVDALTDPDIPPLPVHISLEQARNFLAAVAKGDPDAPEVLQKSLAAALRALVPR